MTKKEPKDSPTKIEGIKHDSDKLDWTMLPFEQVEEVIKVLKEGAKTYGRDNWKSVEPKERYLSALFRHVVARAKGEVYDEQYGLSHMAHAVCCALFLMYKDEGGK